MIQRGTFIKVKTKTQRDVCGTCIYQVVEDGLPAPEPHRKGELDGVKCTMIGGSGPAARPGWSVMDSVHGINENINAGITEIITANDAEKMRRHYESKAAKSQQTTKPDTYGTGIEVDI